MVGAKTIQTLRCTMTLDQETEINCKKYEGLNDDDPPMIYINAGPQNDPVVMIIQNQRWHEQVVNQYANAFRLSLKANLAHYMYGDNGNLARECS